MRKSFFNFHQSVFIQCRYDSEIIVMIMNCNIIIEKEQESSKKSKKTSMEILKKMKMNKSFFSAFQKKLIFAIFPFFSNINHQVSLMKSNIINIDRSNI